MADQTAQPEESVPSVSPDGEIVLIPHSKAGEALQAGFRTPTKDEYRSYLEQQKYADTTTAAVAGLLRGATLGTSDLALPELGFSTEKGLAASKEAHPDISTGTEVVGAILPALIPGGQFAPAGAASKLGAVAAKGLAREGAGLGERLLAKTAGGFLEGSLFGAGQSVSESALGDPDLNGQKVMSNILLGGALGGGAGLLGGALEESAAPLAKQLTGLADEAEGTLKQFRNERVGKAIGAIQGDMNKVSEAKFNQVTGDVFEAGYLEGSPGTKEILKRVEAGVKEQGENIGNALRQADELTDGQAFDLRPVVERARKEALEPILGDPALKKDARALEKMLNDYEALAEKGGLSFEKAHKFESNLRKSINKTADSPAKIDSLDNLRGIFREELSTQMSAKAGQDVAQVFDDSMRKFGSFSLAQKWGRKGVARMAGNRFVSPSDYITGVGGAVAGAITAGPVGLALGAAGALANKVLRERGSAIAANIADTPILRTVANHFADAASKVGPVAFGDFAPVMANALAKGPVDALATHMALAESEPTYREASAMAGFPFEESQQQTKDALGRAGKLSEMQSAIEEIDDHIDRTVDRVLDSSERAAPTTKALGRSDFGAKRMRQESPEAHRRRVKEIEELATNPAAIAERVANNIGPLGDVAPGTAAAISAAASRAVQYLQSVAPKPPEKAPLGAQWEPSKDEIQKFSRHLEAVEKPLSILKAAAAGTLTPQQIDAVKAVYPQLYQDIQQRVVNRLSDEPKGIPKKARLMLNMLTGIDVDGTFSPASIQRNQATFSAPSRKSPENALGGTMPKNAKGADKLTVSSRTLTESQKAAQRE